MLKHLREKQPPRATAAVAPALPDDADTPEVKKALQNASVNYSVLEQRGAAKDDKDWIVLCEEIVKEINKHYSIERGCGL